MRLFDYLTFQHVMLFVFPTLVFIIILGMLLKYSHFKGKDSEKRKKEVVHRHPAGIEGMNAPFPLGLILIIAGTVIWGFFYILGTGLFGAKI